MSTQLDDTHGPKPMLQFRQPGAIEDEAILSAEFVHFLLRCGGWMLHQRGDLFKHVLEAGGGDDLKDASRRRAGIPEGVEDTTRLPHVGTCSRFYFPVTDARPDDTFDDEGQLVLMAVDMRIDEDAWLDGMLNDREAPTRQFTAHLEMNPKTSEIDEGPITCSHV